MIKINLHAHTTFSDGKDSIESLLSKFKSLDYFSITDHDNVQSSIFMTERYKRHNYINGVELTSYCDSHISSFDYHYSMHVLAYDFDVDLMNNYLLNWDERRKQAVRNYLYETNNLNGQISYSESRTQLAKQMVTKNLAKDFISGIRKINQDTKGAVCIPTVKEVIDAIHASGGIAVWAHPFILLEHSNHVRLNSDKVQKTIKELMKLNLDGIESDYALFTEEQRKFLNDIAIEHHLYITTGTDYHGNNGDTLFSNLANLKPHHLVNIWSQKRDKIKTIPMQGGRNNTVLKSGSIIKRKIKGNQPLFKAYFEFLKRKQFNYIPLFIEEKENHNFFEYAKGFVPDNVGRTNLNQLIEFMKIIRKMHDLSTEFTKSDQVICHGDLSPCNVVFQGDKINAILDWDNLYIGNREEDISYVLWLWINIGSHYKSIQVMVDEMKLALRAYGNGIDSYKLKLVENLQHRMSMVTKQISKTSPYYENIKNWVKESIEKIEKHKTLFINI